nr:glutathione S-transferase N-terminal domain-containing protein [Methylomarinum sp. Ch1-1]MDP4520111.1 glutathione S-transferase N-terminal domain-containing protein [Methylomarinum sp. Ch1-1]
MPGLHTRQARKLVGSTSLPILLHDGKAIQNSSDILDYLDQQFPDSPLAPEEAGLRGQVLAWEKFADEEIGVPVRMACYHVLLDYPEVVIPLFTDNGPWYGPLMMKIIFPKLRQKMRAMMKINERTVRIAHKRLEKAVDKVWVRLQNREFLVGDHFSRADLATAALLAPLCWPQKYGLNWPRNFPERLETIAAPYREKLAWVDGLYDQYR